MRFFCFFSLREALTSNEGGVFIINNSLKSNSCFQDLNLIYYYNKYCGKDSQWERFSILVMPCIHTFLFMLV